MAIIAFTALYLIMSPHSYLLNNTSHIATEFHRKCVQILPQNSQHHDSLASLVCGEKITDENLKKDLRKTSLIHIFIVSGSHLVLIDEALSILKIPFFLRFLTLTVYTLAVGWQAPAVRALLGLSLRHFFKRNRLSFPADIVVLITGFTILSLFPNWWNSLSLQMSWCAALALCIPNLFRVKNSFQRALISQFSIFVFMISPLWGIGSLHPLSILFNLTLAPIVAYVLLPLAFLSLIFSPFLKIFENVMNLFELTMLNLGEPVPLSQSPPPSTISLWIWVFSLHIFLLILRLRLWQGKDSS